MTMPGDPPPPASTASAERGLRHWTIIGVGAAILIAVFLISR